MMLFLETVFQLFLGDYIVHNDEESGSCLQSQYPGNTVHQYFQRTRWVENSNFSQKRSLAMAWCSLLQSLLRGGRAAAGRQMVREKLKNTADIWSTSRFSLPVKEYAPLTTSEGSRNSLPHTKHWDLCFQFLFIFILSTIGFDLFFFFFPFVLVWD